MSSFLRKPIRLSSKDLGFFAGRLYFILDAGIPVSHGIGMISPHSKRSRLSGVLPSLSKGMLKGESLSVAFKQTGAFPDFFVYMTQVGEESGLLADIMRRLAEYYEKESRMSDDIKSALVYPLMVSALMIGVIVMAMLMVVPSYSSIFEANGVVLPVVTSVLINLSGFIVRSGHFLLLAMSAAMLGVRFSISTRLGKYLLARLLLCIGLYVQMLNHNFSQALELLLISGCDLVRSVDISRNVVNNVIMRSRLQTVLDDMISGTPLSLALSNAKCFDEMLIAMIRLGEDTGRLPQTIAKCSNYLFHELEKNFSAFNKLLEPVITLVLGAILAFIMLAVMLPAFRMADII